MRAIRHQYAPLVAKISRTPVRTFGTDASRSECGPKAPWDLVCPALPPLAKARKAATHLCARGGYVDSQRRIVAPRELISAIPFARDLGLGCSYDVLQRLCLGLALSWQFGSAPRQTSAMRASLCVRENIAKAVFADMHRCIPLAPSQAMASPGLRSRTATLRSYLR